MRWSAIKAAGDGKTAFKRLSLLTNRALTKQIWLIQPAPPALCMSSYIHVGMVAPKMSTTLDVTVHSFVIFVDCLFYGVRFLVVPLVWWAFSDAENKSLELPALLSNPLDPRGLQHRTSSRASTERCSACDASLQLDLKMGCSTCYPLAQLLKRFNFWCQPHAWLSKGLRVSASLLFGLQLSGVESVCSAPGATWGLLTGLWLSVWLIITFVAQEAT